jgi:hypothetical protein
MGWHDTESVLLFPERRAKRLVMRTDPLVVARERAEYEASLRAIDEAMECLRQRRQETEARYQEFLARLRRPAVLGLFCAYLVGGTLSPLAHHYGRSDHPFACRRWQPCPRPSP